MKHIRVRVRTQVLHPSLKLCPRSLDRSHDYYHHHYITPAAMYRTINADDKPVGPGLHCYELWSQIPPCPAPAPCPPYRFHIEARLCTGFHKLHSVLIRQLWGTTTVTGMYLLTGWMELPYPPTKPILNVSVSDALPKAGNTTVRQR